MELTNDVNQATRDLLLKAQDEARSLGQGYVGTEHFLISIVASTRSASGTRIRGSGVTVADLRETVRKLAEENNWTKYVPAEAALLNVGIDVEAVRRETEAEFGTGSLPLRIAAPPFTARMRSLISQAIATARADERDKATPDDVVVALIDDADSVAVRVLRDFGVDLDQIRDAATEARG